MKRVTHRDIAKIARVSHMAVSLALRGHRSISVATRERIQLIAKQIGYRPDPALSALMVYRRGAKPSGYQGTLAWINNHYRDPDKLKRQFSRYFLGAQERCGERGYQLEEFRLADLEMKFSRLSTILRARNIEGLLFPPQDHRRHITRASFDWENYSLIAFGFSLLRPELDVVTNTQFRSARLAIRKLRSRGYRRIGFVTEGEFSERTDQNFLGGFLVARRHFLAADRIPIHFTANESETNQKAAFKKWFSRYAPEVILAPNNRPGPWLLGMTPAERQGCAWALLDVPDDDNTTTGINQNNLIIGRTAVDMLIAKIHANERGIPEVPRRILIEGRWVDGLSAPRITGGAPTAAVETAPSPQ